MTSCDGSIETRQDLFCRAYSKGSACLPREAIAYDLVPLVTQGGALHEVTGDAAILVDPTDVVAIAKGLNRLVALSPEERKARLQRLKLSASRFSAEAAHSKWRQALQYALCKAAD